MILTLVNADDSESNEQITGQRFWLMRHRNRGACCTADPQPTHIMTTISARNLITQEMLDPQEWQGIKLLLLSLLLLLPKDVAVSRFCIAGLPVSH